jgi:hypothetical protein
MQTVTADFSAENRSVRCGGSSSSVEVGLLQRHERRVSLLVLSVSRLASAAKPFASIESEINDPLTALIINTQACQRWLSADPPNFRRVRATMERMIRNLDAVTEVTGHIRAPAQQTATVLADVDEAICEVRHLLIDERPARAGRSAASGNMSTVPGRTRCKHWAVPSIMRGKHSLAMREDREDGRL